MRTLAKNRAYRGIISYSWKEVLPSPEYAMFKNATELERAERDQDADSARIHAAIDAAEKAIAALATRQLDPDEIRKEWCAIRDRTIIAIRDVRRNVIERASSAKQTERWMVQKWVREINDGRIVREFTADLQKVPTRNLFDYLRYLVQLGDLARIQSVNAVFVSRADNQPYKVSFEKILGQFTLSQCGTIGARIANIYSLAEFVDVRITDLFSGHCMKRSRLPVLQLLPRVEGPNISVLDIDTNLPMEARGGIRLLQSLQSEAGYIDARPHHPELAKPLAPHGRTIHWVKT